MNKKRVYELAKDLSISNKELISKIQALGIEIKNHMSVLSNDEVEKITNFVLGKNSESINKSEETYEEQFEDNEFIDSKIDDGRNDMEEMETIDEKYEGLVADNTKNKKVKPNKPTQKINPKSKKPNTKPAFNKLGAKSEDTNKKLSRRERRNEAASNITQVVLPEKLSVKELSEKIGKPTGELIKKLILLGIMATLNQELDYDVAALITQEYGIEVEREKSKDPEDILAFEEEEKAEDLASRPPVVVVMGHVDHGKTSLLDAIRHSSVTSSEAGGITQQIGAYRVNVNGRKITFLDTPGHEAFTAMRARGAQVTDIAILVVAADDGVMPQTIEAINHAKAANINLIVAINKIDKPGANPDKVKQELTEYGLVAEEWGGETICVPVSAKTKIGLDNLLEMVLLVADMMELKANPHREARGTVIEAKLDKQRGPVATFLVQKGTLQVGDVILAGTASGRVRAMIDDKGKNVKKARPSTPVEVVGISEVPEAGDLFYVVEDEKFARNVAETRKEKAREVLFKAKQSVTLEDLFNQIQEGKIKELRVIVKADTQGSVEAIQQSILKLSNEEVKMKIIHGGTGAVTESDVMLASASNALIIGFNVRPEPNALVTAEREKVEVKLYSIIYDALNDIETAMKGMLEPEYKEVIIGHAEVRQLFKVSSVGTIAGAYVTDGKITRNSKARLVRDGIVLYDGTIGTLKRFKDDAKEVATGFECGILLEKYNNLEENDVIEAYVIEAIPRK